jgi:hypothetical protein
MVDCDQRQPLKEPVCFLCTLLPFCQLVTTQPQLIKEQGHKMEIAWVPEPQEEEAATHLEHSPGLLRCLNHYILGSIFFFDILVYLVNRLVAELPSSTNLDLSTNITCDTFQ